MHAKRTNFYLLSFMFLFIATATRAQDPDAAPPPQGQDQGAAPAEGGRPERGGRMGGRGTVGRITSISGSTMEISKPDGTNVAVKLSDSTEFRKDREPAKLSDFKVGDFVMVRGPENPDHSVNAQMIGGRSGNGPRGGEGRFGGGQGRGGGPGGGAALGELGKDYVAGEVKSIDPPKLTVTRTDNVTQTVELNEETSLRKGRDSITMADIHPGDHVIIRGATQNNVFAPKNAMVMSPEQWERMQQMRRERAGQATGEPANPPANPPGNPPANNSPQR